MRLLVSLILIVFYFMACQQVSDKSLILKPKIEDTEVRHILERAWNNLGGWEAYASIDSIVYRKHSVLFSSDGEIESETRQLHTFNLQPSLTAELSSISKDEDTASILDHQGYYKIKNDNKVGDSEAAAKTAILSSHFVLFAPFKIVDAGSTIDYIGIDTIDARIVDVLRVTWDPDTYENHSTDDIWYLHFDRHDGAYVSYMVYHPPTYALVYNLATTTYKGLEFATARRTWRVDSLGNHEYIRGEFKYDF